VTGVDQSYTNNVAVGKPNGNLNDVHVQDPNTGNWRGLIACGKNSPSSCVSDINTNYDNATSYQSPRRFRFNIRGTF
jgi:hypothetical protein